MWKLGGEVHSWRRRIFRLFAPVEQDASEASTGACVLYFRNADTQAIKGCIPLAGCAVYLYASNPYANRTGVLLGLQPAGEARTFVIEAETEEVRSEWVQAVTKHGAVLGETPALVKAQVKRKGVKGWFSKRGSSSAAAPPGSPGHQRNSSSGSVHARDAGENPSTSNHSPPPQFSFFLNLFYPLCVLPLIPSSHFSFHP